MCGVGVLHVNGSLEDLNLIDLDSSAGKYGSNRSALP